MILRALLTASLLFNLTAPAPALASVPTPGFNYVNAIAAMTEELSMTGMWLMTSIGSLFDSEHIEKTLKTQQTLMAEAHKDYQPGEPLCRFGSFVRSIAATEVKKTTNRAALNDMLMSVQLRSADTSLAAGADFHFDSTINRFATTYCDPADNANGLKNMCAHSNNKRGAENRQRINRDVNFTQAFMSPLTLKADFTDETITDGDQDIGALAAHLYGQTPVRLFSAQDAWYYDAQYQNFRRLSAMLNVAQGSFTEIASQKAMAPQDTHGKSGWNYMKAMMRTMGLEEDEAIHADLGDFPSYFAQMEVLGKRMGQSPAFYTNMYDKPTNVGRTAVALEAVKLMQGRDAFKPPCGRMLLSMMIELQIDPQVNPFASVFDSEFS